MISKKVDNAGTPAEAGSTLEPKNFEQAVSAVSFALKYSYF